MKKLFILICILCLSGCSSFCTLCSKSSQQVIAPPVYQGIPAELTTKPDPLPYIDMTKASQDDVAIWVGELWKRYTKLSEQRKSAKELDDKFKTLYDKYVEDLTKSKE